MVLNTHGRFSPAEKILWKGPHRLVASFFPGNGRRSVLSLQINERGAPLPHGIAPRPGAPLPQRSASYAPPLHRRRLIDICCIVMTLSCAPVTTVTHFCAAALEAGIEEGADDMHTIYGNLAHVCNKLGTFKESEKYARLAIRKKPDWFKVRCSITAKITAYSQRLNCSYHKQTSHMRTIHGNPVHVGD